MIAKYKVWLADGWQDCGEHIDVRNPANGNVWATVPSLPQVLINKALDDAENVRPTWAGLTVAERSELLIRIAEEINRRTSEIAKAITLENGKPLAQSKGEVGMTVDHFRWFAEECRRTYGRIVPNQVPGKRHLVMKAPVGVVGAISPWNFPLVLAARKVAPALAAGCPVVLKPASATPVCTVLLAKCIEAAGVPAGVFQLVTGKASMISETMIQHPACRKISFTGSTGVGRKLAASAAKNLTKLSLELGGNAPLIVFDDADLDRAVDETMKAKFRNMGQSCIGANRIYVQAGSYDAFLERLLVEAKKQKVGDGLNDGTDIGPLINPEAVASAEAFVDNAVSCGARLLCGGAKTPDSYAGFPATVLADVPEEARCMHEEIFAPIAAISYFKEEPEAITRANATEYGLSAYAFTADLSRAFRVAEALESGSVGINDGVPTMSCCPFGGYKDSGQGRELGSEGIEAYLETKHVSILL